MAEAAKRWAITRTTVFRLTLVHLVLTLCGTGLLALLVWWSTVGFATREAASEVERSVNVLSEAARLTGPIGLARSIEVRLGAQPGGIDHYLLAAPDRRPLVGSLPGVPNELGWSRLGWERLDGSETTLLALTVRLPDNTFLVVARDLARIHELEEQLLRAAGWVGAGALLVGLTGGLVLGRSVGRRVRAMETALAAVEGGELQRRLGGRGSGDEFDRLAHRIDAVLDRLVDLMATVRQVTDDIAHDLRTPLSRLRHRLEEVETAATQRARTEALARAQAECDALLELFQALLRIAQVEAHDRRHFAPFDLSDVVETVAEIYAPAAEDRDQTLAVAVAPGLHSVGDKALVSQLVANLVDNAIKHGIPSGHVGVTLAQTAPDQAELVITDDGPGIPEECRGRVFRRFLRLDAARTTPGTGLGLAMVKAIADRHFMHIKMEDGAPGLVVRVRVPLVPAAG